jgi:signal transduction histidine kinase
VISGSAWAAICKRIADAAGAKIRIFPDPDGGTLAIVILPAFTEFPA